MHPPIYALQKRILGGGLKCLKLLIPVKNPIINRESGRYPRDYCAMYVTDFLKKHDIRFATKGKISGGHQVALQIWEHGGETKTFPVSEMDRVLAHIAHGTSATTDRINLKRKKKQDEVIKKRRICLIGNGSKNSSTMRRLITRNQTIRINSSDN